MPSEEDHRIALQKYIEDAQTDYGVSDDATTSPRKEKIAVTDTKNMMQLNGIIARMIVEKNRGSQHKNMNYWEGLTKMLLSDNDFLDSPSAREAYGKLRSAIAEVYVYHGKDAESEIAFRQADLLRP